MIFGWTLLESTYMVVIRYDGELISNPAPTLWLNQGDILIVLGHQGDLPQFARYYRLNRSFSLQSS